MLKKEFAPFNLIVKVHMIYTYGLKIFFLTLSFYLLQFGKKKSKERDSDLAEIT